VRGVNVHAVQWVDGRDRARLERLCRYITRPPLANERLERLPDGRVRLELKRVWRDGTAALLFEPDELISRLCAAVPPPRFNMLRYFGVLSAHSALRSEVVPAPPGDDDGGAERPPPAEGDQLELDFMAPKSTRLADDRPAPRKRWAWLLRHVFAADLERCTRCGGPMRWVEAATTPDAIARLLAEQGLAPRPPPAAAAAPLGQMRLPFGSA
jgi:hypothetical protein